MTTFILVDGMPAFDLQSSRNDFTGVLLMAGGKRPGAGRKAGAAWHGKHQRPPTIRELAKSRVREVLNTALDPIAVLVEIANDGAVDVQVRVQAAIGAAPFMFPRLSAAVVAHAPATAQEDTAQLIDRLSQRFARLAQPTPTIEGTIVPSPGDAP